MSVPVNAPVAFADSPSSGGSPIDHRNPMKKPFGSIARKDHCFCRSFCLLLTFGTQVSQVSKSQQVLLPNYVALYKSRLQFGWGTGPSATNGPHPRHVQEWRAPPGMIPNCGLSSLVLTAYGGSRGAAVYPRVRHSQGRPKPNGHAPDPRVTHGQHPFSYRWTAASSSFSSATVRSIMPCAKSSIGNPSTRR